MLKYTKYIIKYISLYIFFNCWAKMSHHSLSTLDILLSLFLSENILVQFVKIIYLNHLRIHSADIYYSYF